MKINQKSDAIMIAVVSFVILAGGLFGIHEQGEFWGRDIGPDGAHGWEIALAFGLPSATTVVGAIGMSWVLLASHVGHTLSARCRTIALALFCAVLAAAIVVVSRHAASVADTLRLEWQARRMRRGHAKSAKPDGLRVSIATMAGQIRDERPSYEFYHEGVKANSPGRAATFSGEPDSSESIIPTIPLRYGMGRGM